LELLIL